MAGAYDFRKPLPLLVRELAPLGTLFDVDPEVLNVSPASSGLVLVDYRQDPGAAASRALMRVILIAEDGQFYDFSLEDGTITATADGFRTDVDTWVHRFPARTGLWTYTLDLRAAKNLFIVFAEAGQGATPGELGAKLLLRF